MAKPNSQTGHGPFGGTADESALADGEASRRDAETDGEHEADWDVPTAPDNSPLSRILGLVLVVVLAGVFSFVAYRKYDEARRNPASLQAAGADPTAPGDAPKDSEASPFGDDASKSRDKAAEGMAATSSRDASGFARVGNSAPPDEFRSRNDRSPGNFDNELTPRPQPSSGAAGKVTLGETQVPGAPKTAGREPDGNPFGDLNSGPVKQAPMQGEPSEQFAGGAAHVAAPMKASSAVAPSSVGSQNPAGMPGANGMAPVAGGPRPAARTGEDADMQNLFPGENAGKPDRFAQNPQEFEGRATLGEPNPLTRTADAHNQSPPIQSVQNQPGRTPPTQSEPMDNDLLDESHAPTKGAADNRGVARLQSDSRGLTPGGATSTRPTAGRAEALLATKERTPADDDSPFGGARASGGAGQQSIPQRAAQPNGEKLSGSALFHATSATPPSGGAGRPSAVSDDPFGGNRPATGGNLGERPGASAGSDSFVAQSPRPAAGGGSVFPVGTTSDAGDYYVVQPQDNFWTISRKKYGTSRYFHALAEVNKARIPDPGRMRPGMKVSTPSAAELEERYAQFLPPGTKVQVTAAEEIAKSAPTGFILSPDGTAKYRTGEHDTLSSIAAKHLGRSSRWIQIYEMNRDKLSSPNQLKVGTELVLPGDASDEARLTEDDDRR